MKIFAGTSSKLLGKSIAQKISVGGMGVFGEIECKKFPDGEIHVKFCDNIRGKDVFLIQSTNSPVNDNIMELLIMIDAAKRASAARVTAVIPFYAYARQDRKEQPRVSITAKMVANLIVAAGADRIITMDLHSPQIQGFFDIPMDHLQALPIFVHELKRMRKNGEHIAKDCQIVSVAPDVGRSKVAVQYAKALNCSIAIVAKERIDENTVHSDTLVGKVEGKTAILIDDLSTTGGTLVGAADVLKKNGAISVIAGITHNVLTQWGIEKINNSCIDKMIVTDTIDGLKGNKTVEISVADLFARAIIGVHENKSVSSLFEANLYEEDFEIKPSLALSEGDY